MLIANPLYYTAFKFLLEDIEIAKRLIATIIDEDIQQLEVCTQTDTAPDRLLLTVCRLCFKATIKNKDGEPKQVLVEIQKSRNSLDVLLVAQHLALYPSKKTQAGEDLTALPVITIYFLGFKLDIANPLLKTGKIYLDITNGEPIPDKDAFIEQLRPDSFLVQLPSVAHTGKSKVEQLLSVFNKKWILDVQIDYLLQYPDNKDNDADLTLMLNRLALFASFDNFKKKIDGDVLDAFIGDKLREIEVEVREKALLDAEKKAAKELITDKDADLKAALHRLGEMQKEGGGNEE